MLIYYIHEGNIHPLSAFYNTLLVEIVFFTQIFLFSGVKSVKNDLKKLKYCIILC